MAPKKSSLKNLRGKPVAPRKAGTVKGGKRKHERLAGNHNFTVLA